MTNEIVVVKVVNEVDEVVNEVQKHIDSKESMDYVALSILLEKLNVIIKDYKATSYDLLCTNSLAVKLEKLLNAVGIISTISIENEDVLDSSVKLLCDYVESIERK